MIVPGTFCIQSWFTKLHTKLHTQLSLISLMAGTAHPLANSLEEDSEIEDETSKGSYQFPSQGLCCVTGRNLTCAALSMLDWLDFFGSWNCSRVQGLCLGRKESWQMSNSGWQQPWFQFILGGGSQHLCVLGHNYQEMGRGMQLPLCFLSIMPALNEDKKDHPKKITVENLFIDYQQRGHKAILYHCLPYNCQPIKPPLHNSWFVGFCANYDPGRCLAGISCLIYYLI